MGTLPGEEDGMEFKPLPVLSFRPLQRESKEKGPPKRLFKGLRPLRGNACRVFRTVAKTVNSSLEEMTSAVLKRADEAK